MWYLVGVRSRLRICSEMLISESLFLVRIAGAGIRNEANCRISEIISNDRGILNVQLRTGAIVRVLT
jgi:hypothetical protein